MVAESRGGDGGLEKVPDTFVCAAVPPIEERPRRVIVRIAQA